MGNAITASRLPNTPPIHMSNGLTAVLLDTLVLAGCDFAASDWEKRIVYWLVTKDQTRSGLGMVGFDVAEIGIETEAQRAFVLRVTDAALAKHRWDALPFAPHEETLFGALRRLRELVVATPLGPAEGTWVPEDLPSSGICEVHRVWLHEAGCIICNE